MSCQAIMGFSGILLLQALSALYLFPFFNFISCLMHFVIHAVFDAKISKNKIKIQKLKK